jgi:hypothetical protein
MKLRSFARLDAIETEFLAEHGNPECVGEKEAEIKC